MEDWFQWQSAAAAAPIAGQARAELDQLEHGRSRPGLGHDGQVSAELDQLEDAAGSEATEDRPRAADKGARSVTIKKVIVQRS